MDKNTIAGLVIIFLILIGFSYLTRPSKEQVAEMQRKQDSIARVDRLRAQELAAQQQAQKTPDNTTAANPLATKSDSIFVQNDGPNFVPLQKMNHRRFVWSYSHCFPNPRANLPRSRSGF